MTSHSHITSHYHSIFPPVYIKQMQETAHFNHAWWTKRRRVHSTVNVFIIKDICSINEAASS